MVAGGTSLALAALGLPPAALAATGLKLGRPEPFSFESLVALARSLAAAPPGPPRPLPAGRARAHRLRGARQDQVRHRLRAVPRRPRPLPGHLLPSRPLLPDTACACTCSRRRPRRPARARSSTTRPTSTCRPTARRARLPDDAGFAGFRFQESRLATRPSWTGARTTGSRSSAPPTSAPSASSTSTACRRAASRSTRRCRTGPRSSPTSRASTSSRRSRGSNTVVGLRAARRARASPAPTGS